MVSASAAAHPAVCKETAILEAATRVFLRHGYGATSMEKVAREARVAKQTLYNHFGSKGALFEAIIHHRARNFLAGLPFADVKAPDVESALLTLGRQFLAIILSSTSLRLYRLMIAEAPRHPELGRMVYRVGPRQVVERLADYFRERTAHGELSVAEPELAAEQFIGMLIGHLQLRALLEVEPSPESKEVDKAVRHAVTWFLEAFGTPKFRPH